MTEKNTIAAMISDKRFDDDYLASVFILGALTNATEVVVTLLDQVRIDIVAMPSPHFGTAPIGAERGVMPVPLVVVNSLMSVTDASEMGNVMGAEAVNNLVANHEHFSVKEHTLRQHVERSPRHLTVYHIDRVFRMALTKKVSVSFNVGEITEKAR